MTIHLHPPRDVARRNLLAVYIGAFFASLGFSFVTPLLPLFVLDLLGGDIGPVGFWVGMAIGISPLLTAATGPYWGALSDRLGQKVMLQRALVAIGVSIGLVALIGHPWQLVGLRAVIGALGGVSVACLTAVITTSRRPALGRNIGLLQAAQTMGQVAGPLLGGLLAVSAGMRPTFVISAGLFGLGFGLVTWLYRDVRAPAAEPRVSTKDKPSGRLAASFVFWATLGVLFTASFLDSSFMVALPLYLPALGAPGESVALLAGLGLSGGALAMAVAAATAGRLSGRIPSGTLILAMLAASALVLVAIVLTRTWWQFVALRVVLGLVAGGLPTLAYAAAAELVPPARRGAVVGMASSAAQLGWAVSPMLIGVLVGVHPQIVFVLDLALVAACALALGGTLVAPTCRAWTGAARARLAIFSR